MGMTSKRLGTPKWPDPDDAPELTDAFFDAAEIRHGDRLVRRGRPPAVVTATTKAATPDISE